MILIKAAKLLTTPAGNLIYHLILVITLALLLILSQASWVRQRLSPTLRWLFTSGGLLSLHVVWIVLKCVAMVGSVDGNRLAGSLSHSVSLFGVNLLAWTCLFPESHLIGDRFTLAAPSPKSGMIAV
ncbi:MAG: hypothetical protein PVJ32_06455 [Anaerolineales bacterium]|jgi:hypothetical protein